MRRAGKIRVRRARLADTTVLARLGWGLNRHERDPVRHFTKAAIRRDLLLPGKRMTALVAELDGKVVGYASYHPAYESGYAARGLYLGDLFVEAGARGKGVGRTLVAAVARAAQRRGDTYVWWTSMADNRRAQAFYAGLGATREPVVAHALFAKAFTRLANEAGPAAKRRRRKAITLRK